MSAGRHARKSRRRPVVWLLAGLLLAASVPGCTSTVTPPPSPEDPVPVFILREARHVGVVLPERGAAGIVRWVEYGFGDWGWYALGHDAWYHAFATVLWPTAGALSRREFAATTPQELRACASWVELDELRVAGAAAERLRARLAAEFAAGRSQLVERPDLRMAFVPFPHDYWLLCTCADVAADWLRELGCGVSWTLIRGSLAVR